MSCRMHSLGRIGVFYFLVLYLINLLYILNILSIFLLSLEYVSGKTILYEIINILFS